jgi:SAM-dependent methyltransferase
MQKIRDTVGSAAGQAKSLKRVLNAGSGSYAARKLHPVFAPEAWEEIRIDIDPQSKPDIVASITDMRSSVALQSFDAIWSSHTLEHLYAHEVPLALAEFKRVLKPDGFALINSPDLESVASLILEGGLDKVAARTVVASRPSARNRPRYPSLNRSSSRFPPRRRNSVPLAVIIDCNEYKLIAGVQYQV